MKKEFNTTGTCFPDQHYMMDTSAKLAAIMALIERGKYFTINRPRQYGKTTTLSGINRLLSASDAYTSLNLSFEGMGEAVFEHEHLFCGSFIEMMSEEIEHLENPEVAALLRAEKAGVVGIGDLGGIIKRLVERLGKKVVLLIDEVDKNSNNQLFVSFLGLLRKKYLERDRFPTFHSVILAGVHDVKTLKLRMGADGQGQYNSPWNIAADFDVEMSFRPHEIAPMLAQYSAAEGVSMDEAAISERLYYHTSGYPFLVSKLCQDVAAKVLPRKADPTRWELADIDAGARLLLLENNTNFDSLIKNMENNPDLYDLAFEILVNGREVPFNPDEPVAAFGRMYGVFKGNGKLSVHNRIYEQRLYNYMVAKASREQMKEAHQGFPSRFATEDGSLDMEGVLLKFQQYMREAYSAKDQAFLERHGRLVFLAFLKPIINGHGHDFKEVQVSEEKRLDVVVTYHEAKYVVELKRWYGERAHQSGLSQLADYLDRQHLDRGYLVIFEHQKQKTWRQETIQLQGKTIFAVWV